MEPSGDAGGAVPGDTAFPWDRRYVVEATLGESGPLKVFTARDSALRRQVIVVAHHGAPAERAEFLDRARVLARTLECAVHLFDCSIGPDAAVLVTERPLHGLADMRGRPAGEWQRYACTALATALAQLHGAGLTGVRLRPETVGFDEDGRLRISLWPVTAFRDVPADTAADGAAADVEALGALAAGLGPTAAMADRLRELALDAYHLARDGRPSGETPLTAQVTPVGAGAAAPFPEGQHTAQIARLVHGHQARPTAGWAPRPRHVPRRVLVGLAAVVSLLAVATVAVGIERGSSGPGVPPGTRVAAGHAQRSASPAPTLPSATSLPPLTPATPAAPVVAASTATGPVQAAALASARSDTTTTTASTTTTTLPRPSTTTTTAPAATTTTTAPHPTTTTTSPPATTTTTAASG